MKGRSIRHVERIVMHDRLYVATTDRRIYLTRIVARGRGTEDKYAFCARIVALPQLGNIKRTGGSRAQRRRRLVLSGSQRAIVRLPCGNQPACNLPRDLHIPVYTQAKRAMWDGSNAGKSAAQVAATRSNIKASRPLQWGIATNHDELTALDFTKKQAATIAYIKIVIAIAGTRTSVVRGGARRSSNDCVRQLAHLDRGVHKVHIFVEKI